MPSELAFWHDYKLNSFLCGITSCTDQRIKKCDSI